MKYRYTAVYSLKGIHLPTDHGDIHIIEDPAIGFSAILTATPDSYTYEGDRSIALANMILDGSLNGHVQSLQNNDLIAEKIEDVRESRKNKIVSPTALVVIGTGEVEWREPTTQHEERDFVICFNGGPTISIAKSFEQSTTALISAFSIEAKSLLEVKKVGDSAVYFRDNGKPVYLYSFSGASSSYGSHTFSADQLNSVVQFYYLLTGNQSLQSVQRLLRSSLEIESDPLRSFLSAWKAAENLVNKIFPLYEKSFFDEVDSGKYTAFRQQHIEVTRGRITPVIKFAAMAFRLSPKTADEDIMQFKKTKSIRDDIQHSKPIAEALLPAKVIRDMTGKYLQLHLQNEGAAKGVKLADKPGSVVDSHSSRRFVT